MKVKTCEEYVLNELDFYQQKSEQLEKTINKMRYDYNEISNENFLLKQTIKQLEAELNELKGIKEEEK